MVDASHSFESYFKRATSPLVVLKLLSEKPMYGYEISQAMKDRSDGQFTIVVLYPVLYRLEKQGFVAIDRSEVVNNRVRSYYGITDAGREHLAQSLKEYWQMHQAFLALVGDEIPS
ncbi:MAG: PadR family transcriptional regulator [Oscillospiraceae bacterium]|nr:PadR family transcriptional regulator [Oscillospiraceae bacterium]MCD8331605.1 PadR family transcriptional regulator [Oscillospiraceae bacterium]